MDGSEFRRIRKFFSLSKADWMYALGYAGNRNTMYINCERYETGAREIPLYLAQHVWLMEQLGRDHPPVHADQPALPNFPRWPGYEIGESVS